MLAATQPLSTEITIYNGGFALVKEKRTLDLKEGRQEVAVADVAQMIESNSVIIRSLTDAGAFSILEQNYQYDLISPIAILNKAVGQQITFNRVHPDGSKERLTGTLVSSPTSLVSDQHGGSHQTWNGMVLQLADGRVILNPTGEIEVGSIPDGLITKPTLVWSILAAKSGKNDIELSYLTKGVSWQSDYVLSLDDRGLIGDLKGWVTLTNTSGTSYLVNTLKLLAGDVARVQPPQSMAFGGSSGARAMKAAADNQFSEEQFSDYHLYTLNRQTMIKDKEAKQVSLLEAFGVPVKKKLVADAMGNYYRYRPTEEGAVGLGEIKPLVQIVLKNDKASKLGMPLPKGIFKVYQRDSAGSLQLLGEDEIDHTPKEDTVTLTVGRAFDVRVDRVRKDFKWLENRRGTVETFEIEVRNRKDTAETVIVLERHWWENKILRTTHEYKKLDFETYEFTVELKPNEVKKFEYVVETRWS